MLACRTSRPGCRERSLIAPALPASAARCPRASRGGVRSGAPLTPMKAGAASGTPTLLAPATFQASLQLFMPAGSSPSRTPPSQFEDITAWIQQTTPETLLATVDAPEWRGLADDGAARMPEDPSRGQAIELYGRVRCPVVVIHGDQDAVISPQQGGRRRRRAGRPVDHPRGNGPRAGSEDPRAAQPDDPRVRRNGSRRDRLRSRRAARGALTGPA